MEEISDKLELLRLQEEKSCLMQKDVEIEERLLLSKQKLEEFMTEKKKLDMEDDEIMLNFNKLAEEFQKQHRYS